MVPSDIALLIGGPILIAILILEVHHEHKLQIDRTGFLRFPLALVLSTAACLGTSLLYAKVNPYVSLRSPLCFASRPTDERIGARGRSSTRTHPVSYSRCLHWDSLFYIWFWQALRACTQRKIKPR